MRSEQRPATSELSEAIATAGWQARTWQVERMSRRPLRILHRTATGAKSRDEYGDVELTGLLKPDVLMLSTGSRDDSRCPAIASEHPFVFEWTISHGAGLGVEENVCSLTLTRKLPRYVLFEMSKKVSR
jgi:hypothetical protein